ncbi:hypothetical protein [Actinoallomurus sp. NPDC050550]|uniref:hypothetical protein n=1 Tax=Actinoallomurus sp. NPDC050550 TaxID=3154937 RepID=UPI0033C4FE06
MTVDLPSGKTTTGTISGVGAPEQVDQNGTKTVVVPVTISLDHPSDAGSLQQASVLVDFPTASRKNVLTVPPAVFAAGIGATLLIGAVAGLYPAIRVAIIPPTASLNA